MGYVYRYLDSNGDPLATCPNCGHDLTGDDGIKLTLAMAGRVIYDVPSQLDSEGFLDDTEDNAVAAGLLSATECGGCGANLGDMDNIEERATDEYSG